MLAGPGPRAVLLVAVLAAIGPGAAGACVTDNECFTFNPCRTNVRCQGGVCLDDPVICENRGPCVLSHCDQIQGCVYPPACPDDGVACNGVEYCVPTPGGPVCQRTSVDCNDGSLCTIDYCLEPFGCQHDPLNCADADACTYDACNSSTGCTHEILAGCCHAPEDCPDQACQVDRTCVASFCSAGTPRDCDDADPSTLDTCDPAVGCVHTSTTPTTMPPGPCGSDADCTPDPDACRLVACVAGQGCLAGPRTGFDAVACVCRRALPAPCAAPLPRRIGRPLDLACAAIERAAGASTKKQARLVARMGRLVGRAQRAVAGKPGRTLPAGCGAALGASLDDAVSRAQAFQQGDSQ